jgi:Tfp pilus assembly protein PilF
MSSERKKDGDSYIKRGIKALDSGKYPKAIRNFEKGLRLGVDIYDESFVHICFMAAYKSVGSKEMAIESGCKAVELNPTSAFAWYSLGSAYSHFNQSDDAINSYNKAIALKPDYAKAYSSLAVVYIELEKPRKAISLLKKAIQSKRGEKKFHANISLAYAMIGEHDKADDALKSAITFGFRDWKETNQRIRALRELDEINAGQQINQGRIKSNTPKRSVSSSEVQLLPNIAEVNEIANDILAVQFGPQFTSTPDGHIQTDIAAACSLSGLMILQETVPDLTKHEPGIMLISEVHSRQQEVLDFMMKFAAMRGMNPSTGWDNQEAIKEPLYDCIEMTKRLAKKFYEICENFERSDYKYIAALTGMKLVLAGSKTGLLDPEKGKGLAAFYVVMGSKTVPHHEALWTATDQVE